jgi:hypothetical protein
MEEYSTNSIVRVLEELGLRGDDTPLAPIDDGERWDSVIGKEVWEDLMEDMFHCVDVVPISSEDDSVPY